MKIRYLSIFVLILAACNGADEASPNDLSSQSDADQSDHVQGSDKSKDMKALFGDDYERGDIGHAFGKVVSIVPDRSILTIDHGLIHGTDMGAMTMQFSVLADVELSDIDVGDKVEFLVRKSSSGTYDVMAICDMGSDETKCLDSAMGE